MLDDTNIFRLVLLHKELYYTFASLQTASVLNLGYRTASI
jgi:hypothetical protein